MTDSEHDLKHLRFLAESGDKWAQSVLAYAYETGSDGLRVDYAQALQWYMLSAAQNYSYAQDRIGYFYAKGLGVKLDYAEALKWFRLAAEQGNASAAGNIGLMYIRGYGVDVNYAEARRWLLEGAELGSDYAQALMGEMAEKGWGAPPDKTAAINWYKAAAEKGHPQSIKRLKELSPVTFAQLKADIDARGRRAEPFGDGSDLDKDTPPTRH